jgi:seipin
VTAALFSAVSVFLLCIAALAYPVFYYNYVPKKVVSVPVHLQYKYVFPLCGPSYHEADLFHSSAGLNPYGIASVSPEILVETAYDVTVEMTVPRSPPNLARGNFMLALFATRNAAPNPAQSLELLEPEDVRSFLTSDNVVFTARRPVLIPFSDPLVEGARRMVWLPWRVLMGGAGAGNAEVLSVPMGELVEWRSQAPVALLLDVQAGQTLQVYNAKIKLVARLSGVRWFMYNYRISAFIVFTGLFWSAEMISMGIAALVLTYALANNGEKKRRNRNAGLLSGADDGDDGDEELSRRHPSSETMPAKGESGDYPGVKDEDEDSDDERYIKQEEDNVIVDLPKRDGDADEEDNAGIENSSKGMATGYDKARGTTRRRSADKEGLST